MKKFMFFVGFLMIFTSVGIRRVFADRPDFDQVTLCHASPTGAGGSGPAEKYELITVDNQGQLNGHLQHPNDIIPAPDGGCPVIVPTEEPTATVEPTEEPTEEPLVCEDPDANNVGQPLPCTYDPEEVCTNPAANNVGQPLPCTFDPTVEPTEDPTCGSGEGQTPCPPTDIPPTVVVVPTGTPGPGGLDVPTCEEMSHMTIPEDYDEWRWGAHWDKLDCSAKGYQTGSGGSIDLTTILLVAGVLMVLAAVFVNPKRQTA